MKTGAYSNGLNTYVNNGSGVYMQAHGNFASKPDTQPETPADGKSPSLVGAFSNGASTFVNNGSGTFVQAYGHFGPARDLGVG